MRDRWVSVGAALSLLVTAALVVRILVIDKPGVIVILVPALAGALLALWKPGTRLIVALACALTALTAVVSLIGGVGLLYVPAVVLFAWASFRREDAVSATGPPQEP